MNSAKTVDSLVEGWKKEGLSKTEIIVKAAEAEIGWPYVWGATGQECNPAKREAFAKRGVCPEGESAVTVRKCQVLNGSRASCEGCKWYPGCQRVLIDDCQGFVKQILKRVGISMTGGGASSMWRTASNWEEKGTVDTLPEKLCCIFWQNPKKATTMDHVGFYIGGGWMIHCSGEVKKEKLSKKVTHWAVPKGLEGVIPVPDTRPTLRKGSSGPYVLQAQTRLIELGYDLGRSGADGKFGAKTVEAVRTFQKEHALGIDGIIGPKTWEALDKGSKPAPVATYSVTIRGLTSEKADEIIGKYGGEKSAE